MTTPKRWQEIDRIFAAALERGPAARAAFLDEACAASGCRGSLECGDLSPL